MIVFERSGGVPLVVSGIEIRGVLVLLDEDWGILLIFSRMLLRRARIVLYSDSTSDVT